MKLRKALLAIPLIAPATIVPLSTMTSCSQVWGFKTPISIGTNIQGGDLDPFKDWRSKTTLVDLNGESITPQLQSNFAIDMASSTYYGYSLPQKWNGATKETETLTDPAGTIDWTGKFEDGSAAWYTPSSSAFTLSSGRSGKKTVSGTTTNVSETKYSYRNNILSTNIELVSIISNAINQFLNYSLQYQGTQLGTEYVDSSTNPETNTDLAIAWGGSLNHGAKDSNANKNLFESIFSSNAISGTGKTQAVLRPTHVEINFEDLPVAAYTKSGSDYVVSDTTKILLTGENNKPSKATKPYWTAKTDAIWSGEWTNIRTGKKEKGEYVTYTFNNVPVLVRLNSYAKSFVNPTINGGYQVSDFYVNKNTILNAVGNSWQSTIGKYTDGVTAPTASSYQWKAATGNALTPKAESASRRDGRLYTGTNSRVQQNDFIVLLNFQYKECTKYKIGEDPEITTGLDKYDRVSMIGFSNIFPACFLDESMKLVDNTFFVRANTDKTYGPDQVGYIINSSTVNNLNNEFLNLVKRSSKEGMKAHAKDLSDHSKNLLKFLGYMFGTYNDSKYTVNTTCITKTDFPTE